jgi:hypothetical protein
VPQAVNASTAIENLRLAAVQVESAQNKRNEVSKSLVMADASLEAAQTKFNEARTKALEFVPALETGFPLKTETVGIVDGKVRVVET